MKVQGENSEFILPPPNHPSEKYSFVELSVGKFPASVQSSEPSYEGGFADGGFQYYSVHVSRCQIALKNMYNTLNR